MPILINNNIDLKRPMAHYKVAAYVHMNQIIWFMQKSFVSGSLSLPS